MAAAPYTLEVSVVNVQGVSVLAGQRVFCRLECNGAVMQTRPRAVAGDATWNEDYQFPVAMRDSESAVLLVNVFTTDSNTPLGRLELPLSKYKPLSRSSAPAAVRRYTLLTPRSGAPVGTLGLRVRLVENPADSSLLAGRMDALFYGVNALIALMSIALIGVSGALAGGWGAELSVGPAIPKGIVVVGVATIVVAVLGLYAAHERHPFWIKTFFYALVFVMLLELIVAALCIANIDNLDDQLSHGWDRLRGDVSARDSAHELQQDLRCCGFGSMEDRPINPCPKTNGERLALPGCRAELFGTVSRQLEALAVLAVAVAALQALGLVVSWQLAGAREANAIAAPGKTVEDTL